MKNKFNKSFLFTTITFIFSCSFIVAQKTNDVIVFMDSSKVNAVVKSVLPPEIQYNDYNVETQKEGALHSVSVIQVARIEYSNGRTEYNADWMKTMSGKESAKANTLVETYKNIAEAQQAAAKAEKQKRDEENAKSKESTYESAMIVKTNLSADVTGFINLGLEKTINKNFSFEAYLGYAGQNKNRNDLYLYEGGYTYTISARLRSGGIFSEGAIKWYPGVESRRFNRWFQTEYHNAAPHGWYLALRQRTIFMKTSAQFTYTNATQPDQKSKGSLFMSSSTLNVGYQQSRILKVLSIEANIGLGVGYRKSPAVNITSPGDYVLEVIPAYNNLGAVFYWGFTIGVDLNAFKKSLK